MLKDTITALADEIAEEMFAKYMSGSNEINVELKWVVYALFLETGKDESLIKDLLVEGIGERFEALKEKKNGQHYSAIYSSL